MHEVLRGLNGRLLGAWPTIASAMAMVAVLAIAWRLNAAPTGLAALAVLTLPQLALVESLRRALIRERGGERNAQAEILRLRTLFAELQHRVANNMQFAASLLNLQARRTAQPEIRAALGAATTRLDMFARIHRRLYDPMASGHELGRVIEEIGQDLLRATDMGNVAFHVDVEPVEAGIDRLTSLALLVSELLTNAAKHAFPDGRPGTLSVRLWRAGPDRHALEVRDDGVGLAAPTHGARERLGTQVVSALVRQLGGTLSVTSNGGTVARIDFPS